MTTKNPWEILCNSESFKEKDIAADYILDNIEEQKTGTFHTLPVHKKKNTENYKIRYISEKDKIADRSIDNFFLELAILENVPISEEGMYLADIFNQKKEIDLREIENEKINQEAIKNDEIEMMRETYGLGSISYERWWKDIYDAYDWFPKHLEKNKNYNKKFRNI